LKLRPNLDVQKLTPPVMIGGLSGVAVDVTVRPPDASLTCPYLADGNGDVTLADPDAPDTQLSVPIAGAVRYVLLDRGDGQTLVAIIETQDRSTWGAWLPDAMQIVQSFEFVR
jgi:hypothetical protein